MESCLYEGVVHHERLTPVSHRFQYRLYMAYLDLAELPELLRMGLISESRFGPASFVRRDHFGDSAEPLAESVRAEVRRQTGVETPGPIRVLTPLRSYGYYFSPLTMYYCFAADGVALQSIVALVRNTPWRERHAYVLWEGNRDPVGVPRSHRHAKKLHVSPFMGMDVEYRWRVESPGERLGVSIENGMAAGETVFRAGMNLRRCPLTRQTSRRMQVRYACMTARITAAIYYQAFQLWRKRCPFHSHPKHREQPLALVGASPPPVPESSDVSAGVA